MNDHFVNVKVDREERPDIDQIYQVAQQLLTQRAGGWPLTMFLTPDQRAVFRRHLFPESRRATACRVSRDLLARVRAFHDENPRRHPRRRAKQLVQALAAHAAAQHRGARSRFDARAARRGAARVPAQAFDDVHGGFSGAPKFPHPDTTRAAAAPPRRRRRRAGAAHGHAHAAHAWPKAASTTSWAAASRATASTREWTIPHFEKMLYDNGWLLRALRRCVGRHARAALRARLRRDRGVGDARDAVRPKAATTRRSTPIPKARKASSTSGRATRCAALLAPDEFEVAALAYGLDRAAQLRGPRLAPAWSRGRSRRPRALLGDPRGRGASAARLGTRASCSRRARSASRPGRDDKVLTTWNALMIDGMARAARVFGRADWLESARARARLHPRARCGTTAACSPPTRTAARISTPTSTTTPSCWRRCSRCCRRDFRPRRTSNGRSELADVLLERFEDRRGTAASSSPPTTTSS